MLRHLMPPLLPLLTLLVAGSPPLAAEPPERAEPAARLHPSDEQFLLRMRQQINQQAGQPTPAVAPPEQQEKWFREGLQQAAVNEAAAPAPASRPSPEPWGDWPQPATGSLPQAWPAQPNAAPGGPSHPRRAPQPDWVAVLEAALQLERVAHELDRQQLWEEAASVRATASKLRGQAQQRASKALAPHPDRPPREGGDEGPTAPHNRY